MIVSINQPAYLPWLGYFHRIAASDRHVVLDHVQFEKGSVTNRNKVRTEQGECRLTVPVQTSGQFGFLPIAHLAIDNRSDWRAKHWKTIQASYGKCPHFEPHRAFFESVYVREWDCLAPLCREVTDYLLQAFGITTPLVYSSDLDPQGVKDGMLLDLCRKTGAITYLSGPFGRDYLRPETFDRAGIGVAYQDYRHPEYAQKPGGPFVPYLSAIDLLFNHGERSREILMSGQEPIRE